jgi:protein-arginine kinase activator protein McsA
MLCDLCKQQVATVHLTQSTSYPGQNVECTPKNIHLCDECSKVNGVDDPSGFSMSELLRKLLKKDLE